jgi:hypothetical protein
MRTRFDTEARIAVAQATDIARELGHAQVGPDHLLLGLLANLRGQASAALADHGLRLDTARDLVAAQHVDAPEATEDHDTTPTDAEPTGLDEDRAALRAIGIDLDRVREAVRDNLGADLTADWGVRPERGRRGPRGPRGERGERGERGDSRRSRGRRHEHNEHHEHHEHDEDHEHDEHEREHGDRHGRGRGRRGPRSRRFDGPAFSAQARDVLRDVRRATMRDRISDDESVRDAAPGMTGPRLLAALLRSDDPVVLAVFATATDLEGLRARV